MALPLQSKVPEIGEIFEHYLSNLVEESTDNVRLRSIISYVLFPGGKRVRPGLFFAVLEDLGGDLRRGLSVAASLELFHSASLIHDDLPAIDDDDVRRGRPSCHIQYPEGEAIVAGDFLMSLALKTVSIAELTDKVARGCLVSLSTAYSAVSDGQHRDLLGANNERELETLRALKTGALFRAAAECAAIIAEVGEGIQPSFAEFGAKFGLAFQIQDDLLDEPEVPCNRSASVKVLGGSGSERPSADSQLGRRLAAKQVLSELYQLLSAAESRVGGGSKTRNMVDTTLATICSCSA